MYIYTTLREMNAFFFAPPLFFFFSFEKKKEKNRGVVCVLLVRQKGIEDEYVCIARALCLERCWLSVSLRDCRC